MMPPNVIPPAAGLLTTIAPQQQPGTANPLNTAFLPQPAIFFPQQASSSLANPLVAQQDSAANVYSTAAQLNALSLQQQQYQQGNHS